MSGYIKRLVKFLIKCLLWALFVVFLLLFYALPVVVIFVGFLVYTLMQGGYLGVARSVMVVAVDPVAFIRGSGAVQGISFLPFMVLSGLLVAGLLTKRTLDLVFQTSRPRRFLRLLLTMLIVWFVPRALEGFGGGSSWEAAALTGAFVLAWLSPVLLVDIPEPSKAIAFPDTPQEKP